MSKRAMERRMKDKLRFLHLKNMGPVVEASTSLPALLYTTDFSKTLRFILGS